MENSSFVGKIQMDYNSTYLVTLDIIYVHSFKYSHDYIIYYILITNYSIRKLTYYLANEVT